MEVVAATTPVPFGTVPPGVVGFAAVCTVGALPAACAQCTGGVLRISFTALLYCSGTVDGSALPENTLHAQSLTALGSIAGFVTGVGVGVAAAV